MARTSALTPFLALPEIDGVYTARNANLRCSAITLNDGNLCLFSPVSGLGDEALQSLADIGAVTHLLAPNHYHNKALPQYVKAFPTAQLCAPPAAKLRLEKITGLAFDDLSDISQRLPAALSFLTPAGLKTGEVWLHAKLPDSCAWFVVDALAGPKMTNKLDRGNVPGFLGTFPKFGVKDTAIYTDWFFKQLREDHPTVVVPCHGGIVVADDLSGQIEMLMGEYF